MTKEDIIRMAREAGFERTKMHKALERFAVIVAAAEREKCADELFNDGWGYAAKTIRARGAGIKYAEED
jgi:hypothetical protein